jgi:glycogen phosphorylase
MNETTFELEVRPNVPESLSGLHDLAANLLYSWDRNVRGLFYRLDHVLWEQCDHNPKLFLHRVSQQVLLDSAEDHVFMEEYARVMSAFNSYLQKTSYYDVEKYLDPEKDLVAYFCAEFGLHESFPIYSGGLGILAGDHCKAASDLGLPFVAIGLLYRQGYFTQAIDSQGQQIPEYAKTRFSELPVKPALDEKGQRIYIIVDLPGRSVQLRAWHACAGHINMYLLDSNLKENNEDDRKITFQLYGGDTTMRLQQEIVLGIGGVRLLRALGLKPTAWHINEGHAAFQILERCREQVENGMTFSAALELVASGTVFTTHTPVPAGHDMFDDKLMSSYFGRFSEQLRLSFADFMQLGASPVNAHAFNMTALALRGSRFHNGVSRIHGDVASRMESYIWPQIPHDENPMTYVTNGVHAHTFLAREWVSLFDMRFREWRNKLLDENYWQCIDDIPDHRFWSLRQELKSQMLEDVYRRTLLRYRRNGCNESLIRRVTQYINKPEADMLVLGFARRFATYKRATLIFNDPERLAKILNNPEQPVVLIFAGKAHPKDRPGQELIRQIHEFAHRPEFIGRIILLEDYNMAMARRLVTGVDVWVNTPQYPLEASGTSGQKAAINGVLNLSVLDGWWGEGYNGKNGWGITPHGDNVPADIRDKEEASDLLDLLENEIVPFFYNRAAQGFSKYWVKLSKASMKSCIPAFNSARMVMDYVRKMYAPARNQYARLRENNAQPAIDLALWKKKVREHWHRVSLARIDESPAMICTGEFLPVKVKVFLDGLQAQDVAVECLVGIREEGRFVIKECHRLQYDSAAGDSHLFSLQLQPGNSGMNYYKLRMYPYHSLLSHHLETGCMVWL